MNHYLHPPLSPYHLNKFICHAELVEVRQMNGFILRQAQDTIHKHSIIFQ